MPSQSPALETWLIHSGVSVPIAERLERVGGQLLGRLTLR
jgi:hypothetical protein